MADKNLNIKVRAKGAKRAKQELKGVQGGLVGLGKAAVTASAAFFGAKMLIDGMQKVIQLAERSGKIDGLSRSFISLGKEIGFTNNSLDKLRIATNGTLDSMELMTQANNAMLLGIVESDDEMAELFDTAQRLAKAVGKDAVFGIESLVTGLGRQSKLMLDNIGIVVKTEDAYKSMADRLEKNVSQLTDNEKKQAFLNATLESARDKVKSLGPEVLDTSDSLRAMQVSVQQLSDSLGKAFEPAVGDVSIVLNEFIKDMAETDWSTIFSNLNLQLSTQIPMWRALTSGISAGADKIKEQQKVLGDDRSGEASPFPSEEEMFELQTKSFDMQQQSLQLRINQELPALELEKVKFIEINSNAEKLREHAAQTASSLFTSAIMGDNVGESLKRAVIQLGLMVAQAKIYNAVMNMSSLGGGGFFGSAVKFLFGASPTHTASSSNVTINQSFGGMGVIDQNFATNQIIPAINKAISTGQARIAK